jgi:hypothetical protein
MRSSSPIALILSTPCACRLGSPLHRRSRLSLLHPHGITVSVILAGTLYQNCLALLLFIVIRVSLTLCVMLISSVTTPGCLFILPRRILIGLSNLFSAIYGPCPFLVSPVTSTIWWFLMILPIIYGLFHYS